MKLFNPLALAGQRRRDATVPIVEQGVGDLEGFEAELAPLKDGLYGFILKSLGFAEDAADVYQETVLRAFKYRHGFKRGRSFKTWIFTIADNEVKRYFRKAGRSIYLDREAVARMMTGAPPDEAERVQEIFAAAATLTQRQKRIFFLFYESGFPVREIARITGVTANNVKVTLNQCRNRIREHMGEKP